MKSSEYTRRKKHQSIIDLSIKMSNEGQHHPTSILLANFLRDFDFYDRGDILGWKFGGDGDNGEELLLQLDVYFRT